MKISTVVQCSVVAYWFINVGLRGEKDGRVVRVRGGGSVREVKRRGVKKNIISFIFL